MSATTILNENILHAAPSLYYVSATVKSLHLQGEYADDHHVCAFVLAPLPEDGPPTIVMGAVAEERDAAIRALAMDAAKSTWGKFPQVAQKNQSAIYAFQQDVANSSMAQELQARAQAFNEKVRALAESGDPVLKALLDGIKTYVGDLLFLCDERSYDPANFAAIQNFISGYLRSSSGDIDAYLKDGAEESVEGFRADVGEAPQDPTKIN